MKQQVLEKDYFSIQNLNQLTEINEHMSFIDQLIEKYMNMTQFASIDYEWNPIQDQLNLIKNKINDKKLNISIIGEFSTGKSTFINALIRKELLVSSALQGTTVASTIIDYDKNYKIHIEFLDNRQDQVEYYSSFSKLKNDLDIITTKPEIAKSLKTVKVYLPSEILKNNFRIIDTPGTNVTEAWHEDVTVRTLKNDSDLSIILISAERPATKTMLNFVENNLTSILPQCIFVVTKLDLLRKKERNTQLSYIKMKLEEELKLKNAIVLPYISPTILDSQISDNDRYINQRKICVIGDINNGLFPLSPIIKISNASESMVRLHMNDSKKLIDECLSYLPKNLQDTLKKKNDTSLHTIELSYKDFSKCFLENWEIAKRNYRLFHTVEIHHPLNNTKNNYYITMYDINNNMDINLENMDDIIIVLNSINILNEEERLFIHRIPKSIDHKKIIFAVNPMNKIYDKEIPKLKEYVEKTLSNIVSDPRICYISINEAQTDIKELTQMMKIESQEDIKEDIHIDEELLNLSLETETKLVEHTMNQKTLVITKKLVALIDDVYISISQKIEQISNDYEEKLDLLNRSSRIDLSTFVNQEKTKRLRRFDEGARKIMSKMDKVIIRSSNSISADILKNIDKKVNMEEINTYIHDKLGNDCIDQAQYMISKINRYYKEVRKQFKEEINIYNQNFTHNYKIYNIVEINMREKKYRLPQDIEVETANISSAANYIAQQVASENKAMLGGAAAGAAIGTAFAPGIGTILGGIVGLFAGGGLAPDFESTRKGCKEKLSPQLKVYYENVGNKMIDALEKYTKQIRQYLNEEIDGYLIQYKKEVENLIIEENKQKSVVNSKIKELDNERNQIRNRKTQLESVMSQLNHFGRKEN